MMAQAVFAVFVLVFWPIAKPSPSANTQPMAIFFQIVMYSRYWWLKSWPIKKRWMVTQTSKRVMSQMGAAALWNNKRQCFAMMGRLSNAPPTRQLLRTNTVWGKSQTPYKSAKSVHKVNTKAWGIGEIFWLGCTFTFWLSRNDHD